MEVDNAAAEAEPAIHERMKAFLNPAPPDTPEPESEPEIEADGLPDETEAEVTEPEEQTFTVKVDGETVEVPLSELLSGYSRTSDYTRKTQALAEDRKATDAELKAIRDERQQLAKKLEALEAALPDEPNIDWEKLRNEDPIEYLSQKELQRERRDARQLAAAERDKLLQQQAAEQQQYLQQHIAAESERLLKAIPTWADEKKALAEKQAVIDYARSAGFSDEELSHLYDHRAVVALRKAMLYDKMMANARSKTEAVKDAPKTAKPGVTRSGSDTSAFDAARRRLSKSGRTQDLADALKTFI